MAVSVYQYFDLRGRLLYVGVTARGIRRAQEHAETKDWWPQTVGCTIAHFDTRDEALAREEELIRSFAPPYNTVHNANRDIARQLHTPLPKGAQVTPPSGARTGPNGMAPKRPKRRPLWERQLIAAERRAAEEGYVPRF